ncbi:MAG: cell division protein FtsA [Rickettsiales bacterium]|jgi:cell division protein FtsA
MISKNKGKIVACLDIGTTKLVCLIAEVDNKNINIIGYGYRESKGIVASAISDMRLAQKSITNVVCDAERMAGFNIDQLVVGLSGAETLSQKKIVKNKIAGEMVKSSDITNLANAVRFAYKKNNREIIHLLPLKYQIDDSNPVQNPRYMTGKFLSSRLHIVSSSSSTVRNISNCLNRCQLSVYNYISESYSSALASITSNESNLCAAIIDIGGGDTSFSIILENKLVQTGNINVGGIQITKDVSMVLNIDFDNAETIKNLNNSLFMSLATEKEMINVKMEDFELFDATKITKKDLRDIIQSRLEEIIESVKKKMEESGYGAVKINNIILTGGSANIIGIEKIANKIFDKPARIGYPSKFGDIPEIFNDSSFCSVFGMLIFLQNIYNKEKIKEGFETKNGFFSKIIDRLMSI